tara:strand:- start:313 stop:723 length:411 start_codon:yes stop_codon:yes gene_type:complete
MDKQVIKFLKKCKIQFNVEDQLDGQLIPREILLSKDVYNEVKEEIVELKKKFSSSSLTSLQKTAESGQKWPLLNLVRQVLKTCNYQMKPIRKSDGYKKDGKKKYKRFFLIGKYTSTKNTIVPQVDPSANPILVLAE